MPGSSFRDSHQALAWYQGCRGDQATLPWEVRKKTAVMGEGCSGQGQLVPRQLGEKGWPFGGIAQVGWSVAREVLGLQRRPAGLRNFIPKAMRCF